MLAGVLALQGDYQTHAVALESVGVKSVEIRTPEDAGFANPKAPRDARKKSAADMRAAERPVPDLLVLPGGESSTFDLLGRRYGLDFLVSAFAASGRTLFGTCAGAIWLGKGAHHRVTPLGLIDVTLERNAYGRQIDSFIASISIHGMENPLRRFSSGHLKSWMWGRTWKYWRSMMDILYLCGRRISG